MPEPSVTLAETVALLKELDPKLTEDDEAFRAGLVLLTAANVGANVRRVASFTGFPRREVSAYAARLRANGIWKNGRIHVEWAEGGEGSGVAFWCDVNVACGIFQRTTPHEVKV